MEKCQYVETFLKNKYYNIWSFSEILANLTVRMEQD